MIKSKFFLLLVLVTLFIGLNAQNGDCNTLLYFQDSIGTMPATKGYGQRLEIKDNSIKNEYLFTKEHNTTWAVIHFTMDASFQFELVPEFADDDFDFVIFNFHANNTCDSIENKKILPIRSNLSKRTPEKGSVTGLKKGYENHFSAAGPNPSFSKPFAVSAGDSILLIIDSPYGSKGDFSIFNFTEYFSEIKENIEEEIVVEPRAMRVTIITLDENGKSIEEPNIYLKSLGKEHRDNPQYDEEGNIYSEFFNPAVEQVIIASQREYLFQKYNFRWDGERDTIITIQLTPLTIGTKLQFENILFLPNSPQFLTISKEELSNLLLFLKSNPTMEVEIGGHVHGTRKRNIKKYRKLSEDRAIAVYNYAVNNGIEATRLTYKGYGNSQMIFRPAKNESEIKANRRVEFTITKVN